MLKMITIFQGYNNIMTTLLFVVLFVFLGALPTDARHYVMMENTSVERSMGDELRREAGYGDEKLSTVVVTGSVLCDACFGENSPILSHPVVGASVAVSCDTSRKTSKSEWVRGTTDEYGDFLIDLPSHLHARNIEKSCIVKILDLPKSSLCNGGAFTREHMGMRLSSVKNGFRTYTAVEFHLSPKFSQKCITEQSTF